VGIVTAKQLKNSTGEVLRRVRSGEIVTVTIRGTSVAQFIPLRGRAQVQHLRQARASKQTVVRSVAGRYRGVGTLREFLKDKAQEIRQER